MFMLRAHAAGQPLVRYIRGKRTHLPRKLKEGVPLYFVRKDVGVSSSSLRRPVCRPGLRQLQASVRTRRSNDQVLSTMQLRINVDLFLCT